MSNDKSGSQNQSQQGGQQQGSGQSRSQSDLESIIRGAKFGSPSEASTYFQQHGLNVRMQGDNTAEIMDTQNGDKRVATVNLSGTGQQRDISNISY
jgi:hypothetical protein